MALPFRTSTLNQLNTTNKQSPIAAFQQHRNISSAFHPASLPLCSTSQPGAGLCLPCARQQHGRSLHRVQGNVIVHGLPFDQAWAPSVDVVSLAPNFFAASLFPYLAFLYFLHSSGKTPKLTLFGFYFLLAFVSATIPAGIYAKVHYGTNLANVDWLHGLAESLLTITNLLIVLGLRKAIREEQASGQQQAKSEGSSTTPEPQQQKQQ